MKSYKSKTQTKEYSPFLESFLIDYFKLKPNRYTQNDYLFTRQGQDYDVSYNPRCQLLDITPVSNRHWEKHLPYHAERITREVKRLWEDLAFTFMLEYGRNIEDFMVARLYALQSDSHPYITYLTKNDNEWDEVANWSELASKYQKRKLFQYAYFGSAAEQKKTVPAKIKKEIEKSHYSMNRDLKPNIMPEHIVRAVTNQDEL